ncbi:hypothetical protein D3C85_1362080 [compost metagenome]
MPHHGVPVLSGRQVVRSHQRIDLLRELRTAHVGHGTLAATELLEAAGDAKLRRCAQATGFATNLVEAVVTERAKKASDGHRAHAGFSRHGRRVLQRQLASVGGQVGRQKPLRACHLGRCRFDAFKKGQGRFHRVSAMRPWRRIRSISIL